MVKVRFVCGGGGGSRDMSIPHLPSIGQKLLLYNIRGDNDFNIFETFDMCWEPERDEYTIIIKEISTNKLHRIGFVNQTTPRKT